MGLLQVGNKSTILNTVIRNNDTVQINAGQPVVLSMDGNGVDVVLPSTAAALNLIQGLKYGVALHNVPVGGYDNATVFGFCNSLQLLRQSRTSSTVNWAAENARSIGEYLSIDTVNNMFVTAPSTVQYLTVSNQASPGTSTLNDPDAVLGVTLPSYVSSTSAVSDTRLYITAAVNAFVRMM